MFVNKYFLGGFGTCSFPGHFVLGKLATVFAERFGLQDFRLGIWINLISSAFRNS
jgi:hypothetical protein